MTHSIYFFLSHKVLFKKTKTKKTIQWKTDLEKQGMLKFQKDAVADKGLVHHLLTECMSFIFSSLFFNKGGFFSAQSADPHEES